MNLFQSAFCGLLMCFFLIFCQFHSAPHAQRIDAHLFDAFWIWGDIKSAPYLKNAKELYILQGEMQWNNQHSRAIFSAQGVNVLSIPHQKVWLVYRNHHLKWSKAEYHQILIRIKQWEQQGNQIQGIQIDFDSKTKNIKEYALFLQKLRTQLPKQYQLSITGLLDWTNVSNPETLSLLRNQIDELVIQTYQGTTTIANYQSYLKKITTMKIPYKVGYVQNGHWEKPFIQKNPYFKGNVVFLLRSGSRN